jgi:hypothetical protein
VLVYLAPLRSPEVVVMVHSRTQYLHVIMANLGMPYMKYGDLMHTRSLSF